MSLTSRSRGSRTSVATALLVLGTVLAPAVAHADPAAIREVLKRSCTGDYLDYCSDHAPGGPEVEVCFRDNMKSLSPACAAAITAYKREQKPKRVTGNP